jgi:hypothetical protein
VLARVSKDRRRSFKFCSLLRLGRFGVSSVCPFLLVYMFTPLFDIKAIYGEDSPWYSCQVPQAKISKSFRYPRNSSGVSGAPRACTAGVSRSSAKTKVFGLEVALVMMFAMKRGDEAVEDVVRCIKG